ncbi:hypothetical protein NL108_013433, partial [Boleophthalmus pectinirostris]
DIVFCRSKLSFNCNGFDEAIVTQENTPLRSEVVYDGDKNKTTVMVTEEIFSTFAKTHPFSNKSLDTCAVVGNGGILANSSCGEAIDSAQFVIRCNMPPLEGKFSIDVGTKTDIVTANPSILVEKYGRLLNHRRPFVDHARLYGNAMLLTPTFSYSHNTELILRAFYTLEDFELKTRPVSMNPNYLKNLDLFWRSQGLNPQKRLSTGLMMASLVLEICDNVHLYGFWPFDLHPHTKQPLSHHYYDNRLPTPGSHSMPAEFELLLKFHRKGVLKLHLGQCPPPK